VGCHSPPDLKELPVSDQTAPAVSIAFSDLALNPDVLQALKDVGYESPSPIQAATIPHLLESRDVVGQAQTGTGKTAAFALPILSRIDIADRSPQALVLTPTRELAIQVAEAFQRYASHLKGFHVLPIYGGQSYTPQLQSLKRGVHVIVGTPGRVMDHMKRGTLDVSTVRMLVLDEADEMLNMGFLEDVDWILEQTPKDRNVALFSATMPAAVRRIAQRHLRTPAEVTIKSKTSTAANIRQRYWLVSGMHKLDALTRILEAETFDGMLVFTRTKQSTVELAEKLEARGFSSEPLNGDIPQQHRERTVARLKGGQVDIVVATDVAARGLDVERVSHVVNFDVPYDSESYVHRIGRTGRAGRSGEAILFISPRERNMLRIIERATRQPIEQMQLPSVADVNQRRVARFKQRITDALADEQTIRYRQVIEEYEREHNVPAVEIAAALASLTQGKTPLLLDDRGRPPEAAPRSDKPASRYENDERKPRTERPPRREFTGERAERPPRREFTSERPERPARGEFTANRDERPARKERNESGPREDGPMETYRIEVGHSHGVQPGNIVGAIANEAGIDGRNIGRIDIRQDHSYVDLPGGMPKDMFRKLEKARVAGEMLQISRVTGSLPPREPRRFTERSDRAPRPDHRPARPVVRPEKKPHRKGKPKKG
jgi:ATP-dependent RNA helicase DeaD